jgi:hypothetical protein
MRLSAISFEEGGKGETGIKARAKRRKGKRKEEEDPFLIFFPFAIYPFSLFP